MRTRLLLIALGAVLSGVGIGTVARGDDASDPAKHVAGDKKSGYVFAEPETREMQVDDFSNPGFLWVDKGEKLWSAVDGKAGKSCESCHQDAATSMKGIAASYPKYDGKAKKVVDIEQRINMCRVDNMQAEPLKWESDELLGLAAYVKLQSRGMPVTVATDGPARPFWQKGREFYNERRGQLDLACSSCHDENAEKKLRTETLSQGQTNGFPTYRLNWQHLGSVQRRFRECNSQVRAEPYPYGSDEYVDLELYVASRGNGLPVESPSVRK
jgi:sulfur-oxidizing protein SoxA